jgi:hypothetical protein
MMLGRVGRPGRIAALAVAALAVSALAVVYAVATRPPAPAQTGAVPTTFVPVVRGSVSQRIRVAGTYGFDGAYTVAYQGAPGILTALVDPGTVVERGGVLFSVNDRPVRLLLGAIPAYRDFRSGMSDGADVRQIEENLVALGMDPMGLITVDEHFTFATDAAIRRWQASWGVPISRATGELRLGDVVFQPIPLRVRGASVVTGMAVDANTAVLTASSTERVVTVQVSADRQASVEVGDEVSVSVPGASPITGAVIRTSRVASVEQAEDGEPTGVGAATVGVVIGLTPPPGLAELDQATVVVSIAVAVREDVLQVPVVALLARPGGGYRVRLDSGSYVDVEPGLFDEATGRVEVTGDLREGELVEVPAS